jgi:hypothetical protein
MSIQKLLIINAIALCGFLGLIAIVAQVQEKGGSSVAIEVGR